MINICIYCNPNYKNNLRIGTAQKNLDVVSQAIILCNSIKQNWNNFDYDITLFHNKNMEWSEEDKKRISKLTFLNIIAVDKPDHPNLPWQTRIPCFTHPLKREGTHRLVLDCDMVALSEPEFDLECDWQGMFSISGSLPHITYKGYPNYKQCNGNCFGGRGGGGFGRRRRRRRGRKPATEVNKTKIKEFLKKNGFELSASCLNYEKQNLQKCHLHNEYHRNKNIDYRTLYPHFNLGAILLRENLCKIFGECYSLAYRVNEIGLAQHCAIEYVGTYILKTLSNIWKPFQPGFNFLSMCFSRKTINSFLKERKISLLHYPGSKTLEDNKTSISGIILDEYEKTYGESLFKFIDETKIEELKKKFGDMRKIF